MQPDQYSQQQVPPPMPSYTPQKKPGVNIFGISMTIVSLLLLCAIAGLGYYAYTLNTNLTATTESLNALQAEHDALKADYATLQGDNTQLNADIAALQAELDTTKSDLATTQTDLKTAQDQSAALQTKIDAALLKLDVVIGIFVDEKTDKGIEADIRATRDTKLLDLFQAFISSGTSRDLDNFFTYLFESIVEELE